MYQHCPDPLSIKQRRKIVFLDVETAFLYTFPSSDLQYLPPWRSQSSLRITWVSGYWQIIHYFPYLDGLSILVCHRFHRCQALANRTFAL